MREIGIFRSPTFSVFYPLSPSTTHLPTAPPGAHLLPTVCSPSFLLLRELCLLPHEGHWVSRRVRTSRTGSTSVGGVPGWPEKPGLCSQMVRVQSPALPLSGCVTLGESRLFGAWPPYCKMGRQCSPCTHIPKMSEAKYMSQHLAQCLADCRCWKSGPAYFLTSQERAMPFPLPQRLLAGPSICDARACLRRLGSDRPLLRNLRSCSLLAAFRHVLLPLSAPPGHLTCPSVVPDAAGWSVSVHGRPPTGSGPGRRGRGLALPISLAQGLLHGGSLRFVGRVDEVEK